MHEAQLAALLRRFVDDGRVPGAVAVVARADGSQAVAAAGWHDAPARVPLAVGALFRVASLTKAVVAIAALRLVEQGALDLDGPVGDVLPAFDELPVLDGYDGDEPRLRAPARRATIRHLMTHTSGLTYDTFSPNLARYTTEHGIPNPGSGLRACFRTPLVFDPGTRWAYGLSTDWLGLVLEELTGKPLDVLLREAVLDPLGLDDVTFAPDPGQRSRLVPVHVRRDGGFDTLPFDYPAEPEFWSAGHGLHATAGDYAVIQQLLLGGGTRGEVQLLRPETIDLMTSDQLRGVAIAPLHSTNHAFSVDLDMQGVTWGLDTMITVDGRPGLRPPGAFGWFGTFNSFYWIDRANGVTGAVHLQLLPFLDPAAVEVAEAVEEAVYAS